eukprot:CAMPEP_0176398762 /NCGR_PEP_ID=MMETSP0126-20121128/46179_1 /TAXON_ID=141414 ORGANISM="Strombidinopsis acuminatum, Strain SPMC142" /NCGR_SAMPLE_ID=MMETSP0126 /ASSEMBLY_ACC=CAM_ASM_000229 /LENGTH=53 /DNA_ID=CAMNT_0017773857 /DNA_START=170 /DNA_END=331 /DNA_ORIENTATION=+
MAKSSKVQSTSHSLVSPVFINLLMANIKKSSAKYLCPKLLLMKVQMILLNSAI